MPKILKNTKKAIQSRERVRLFRGVQSIMRYNATSNVLNVTKLKQKLINNEDKSPHERISSLNDRKSNLLSDLRTWAIENNIHKRAITALLKVLRSAGITNLPKDSRKLLETPRNVIIVNRAGGKYWHNGIVNCLAESFSKLASNLKVEINLNIDGLPLFKSSPLVFWPILMNVHGMFLWLNTDYYDKRYDF